MNADTMRRLEGWWVQLLRRDARVAADAAPPAQRVHAVPDFEDTAPMTFWIERRRQPRAAQARPQAH